MKRLMLLVLLSLPLALAAQSPTASNAPTYLLPPAQIVSTFDAPPLPQVIVGPTHQQLAIVARRGSPTLAELARPMLRLAGSRVDPKNNGPHRTLGLVAVTLKGIVDGRETVVAVPPQANLANIRFSPDGSRLAFTNTRDAGIELWVADTATGQSRMVSGSDRLNASTGEPCDWLHDNVTLVCEIVPPGRGAAPKEPTVPAGPTVLENHGKAAPAPTYEDMIRTAFDEVVFDYFFTSQLAAFDSASGRRTLVGRAAIFDQVTPSPDGQYLLVSRVTRPYSHLIPLNGFPQNVEIWDRHGNVVRSVAEIPSREGVTLTGVRTGPREYRWRPDQPATLVWAEALDGGDLKNKVPYRDKLMALAAPFSGIPTELAKTEFRFSGVSFTEKGVTLLSESDRASRRVRTWILEPGMEPRKLWDRRQEDRYADPGTPVARGEIDGATTGGRGGSARGRFCRTATRSS